MNDGAAGLLLMSEAAVRRHDLEPLARYVATGTTGVHPDVMGLGPIPATRKVLRRARWRVDELDLAEANAAFASQAVAVIDELGLDASRVHVNGGAIAIGHPLGCSGARLLINLLYELRRGRGRRGLATMCFGVGQGIAMLVEAP